MKNDAGTENRNTPDRLKGVAGAEMLFTLHHVKEDGDGGFPQLRLRH